MYGAGISTGGLLASRLFGRAWGRLHDLEKLEVLGGMDTTFPLSLPLSKTNP